MSRLKPIRAIQFLLFFVALLNALEGQLRADVGNRAVRQTNDNSKQEASVPSSEKASTRSSKLERPFLGAYLNFRQLFKSLATDERREQAIDVALDRFQKSGLKVIMPYVTTTSGGSLYPSVVITDRVYGKWDPLAYLIRSARDRSLEVYPVVCVLSCGHDKPAGVLNVHPEWATRHPDGTPAGHLCPANAEVRAWVTSIVAEVVDRYGPEGILLDYLRYRNRPSRLDASSEKAFKRYARERPDIPRDELLQTYREQALTTLAKEISESARKRQPGLKIAIYSWGPHVASDHRVAQDWPTWSAAGYVDMVNISGYCYPDNYGKKYLDVFQKRIGDAVKLNRQAGGRADITFCLGVVTSHGKIRSADWVHDYLRLAGEKGVTGTAFFTWSTLQPFLSDVDERHYLPAFVAQIQRARHQREIDAR